MKLTPVQKRVLHFIENRDGRAQKRIREGNAYVGGTVNYALLYRSGSFHGLTSGKVLESLATAGLIGCTDGVYHKLKTDQEEGSSTNRSDT